MSDTDPIEWQLLDTDLTTVLAVLPAGEQKLYLEMSEPGSGEVRIPMTSAAAALVASGQFVRAKYRGAYRGGFFVENIKTTDASGGEAGSEWKSISGRGPLALLDDAIVWDDGTINTTREFSEASKAAVLIDLIDEAQARGGLAILTYDFTASLDSDGAGWEDSQAVELTVGKSLLAVARDFGLKGIDFDISLETDGTFTLHAYKISTMGTDKSETIYFRTGTNCTEVSGEELGGGIKNVLRIKYPQGFTTVQDATSISARRRREALISEESAGNSGAAITFGQSKLETTKDPQSSININLYDGVKPFAFVNYGLGDRVTLDRMGTEGEYRVRGMQLTWREDTADIVLSLNSTIIENEIKMALELENLRELWTRLTDSGLPIISFWSALGLPGDTITRINDMVIIGTKLYIAFGDYTDSTLTIGGVTARGVAVMDLETGNWAPLSGGGLLGLSGTAKALAAHGYDLYISGDFNNPGGIGSSGKSIVKYDTLTGIWTSIGTLNGFAWDMVISDGVLYAGGYGLQPNGVADTEFTAKYTISTGIWSALGTGAASWVFAIAVYDGNVYAGGLIGVEVFNGSGWMQLSALGGGACHALAIWQGHLLVAGNFTSPGNYIAYYDLAGAAWHTFGSGLDGICYDLAVSASDFYTTGAFDTAGGISCSRIAKYNGSWGALQQGLGGTTKNGFALTIWDLNVIVGGNFERAGDKPAKAIAVYLTTLEETLNYLDQAGNAAVLHNQLPDVQGGDPDNDELYHLTEDQHGDLTGGSDASDQHGHGGRYPTKWTGKTTAPTVDDDSGDGYAVSDRWIDETNDKEYVGLDVTVGAAVWKETTGTGGAGTPGGSDTEIQVNDGGVFNGFPEFRFDKDANNLFLGDDYGSVGSILKSLFITRDGGRASARLKSFGISPSAFAGLYAKGTKASPTAPLSGDPLMAIWSFIYDGDDWGNLAASIDAVATENHDTTHHGAKWAIGIVPTGGQSPDDFVYMVEISGDGVNLLENKNFLKFGQEYIAYSFDNAISKVFPTDGDKLGFWDEVSGEIRQIPWLYFKDLIVTRDGDTNVAGAELETLTDGSNADTLHAHDYAPIDPDFESYIDNGDIVRWDSDDLRFEPYTLPNYGDVNGPAGAVEGNIPVFYLTLGKNIQDSGIPATSISNGWIPVTATWTRTGDHTYTVSGDVTTTYRKGAKVRYKDGGAYEYGVIGSSSYSSPNTTINLIPNTDYAMAAATITDKFLSYIELPEGFPISFNYTTVVTPDGGAIASYTVYQAKWTTWGRNIKLDVNYTIVNIGTGTGTSGFSPPIASSTQSLGFGRENVSTGVMLQVIWGAFATRLPTLTYTNGTTLGANYQVIASVIGGF